MALPVVAAIASRGWIAPVALLLTLVAYLRAYMPLKRRLIPGSRRKLLIDLTLFVAPVYLGLCWLGGLGPRAAADVLVFVVASGIVVLRGGCFLGGCCRGEPCRVGARYPGVDGRFFPLPLFEMVVGVVLLGAAVGMSVYATRAGTLLAPLAGIYAGYRFSSEFLRARTGPFAVRRACGLTITQWLCAAIVMLAIVGTMPG
ncbi:MAG: prolipoprotein diacylglyceryl transferase family protein [Nannocystaceae bacterium]